jgi:CDGSH-type Zn-finger protein
MPVLLRIKMAKRVHELNLSVDKYDYHVYLCDCGWSRRMINPQTDNIRAIKKEHEIHIRDDRRLEEQANARQAYIDREERHYSESTGTIIN